MSVFHKSSHWIVSIAATLLVLLLASEDTLAQRRGGGRGQGGRGGVDLSPIRNGLYSNPPTGAYDLVKGNEDMFRRLPFPLRTHILDSLTHWDDFFPQEQERFRLFFVKAKEASDGDLRAAFGEAIAGIFGRRPGPDNVAARESNKTFDSDTTLADDVEPGNAGTRPRDGSEVPTYR